MTLSEINGRQHWSLRTSVLLVFQLQYRQMGDDARDTGSVFSKIRGFIHPKIQRKQRKFKCEQNWTLISQQKITKLKQLQNEQRQKLNKRGNFYTDWPNQYETRGGGQNCDSLIQTHTSYGN